MSPRSRARHCTSRQTGVAALQKQRTTAPRAKSSATWRAVSTGPRTSSPPRVARLSQELQHDRHLVVCRVARLAQDADLHREEVASALSWKERRLPGDLLECHFHLHRAETAPDEHGMRPDLG